MCPCITEKRRRKLSVVRSLSFIKSKSFQGERLSPRNLVSERSTSPVDLAYFSVIYLNSEAIQSITLRLGEFPSDCKWSGVSYFCLECFSFQNHRTCNLSFCPPTILTIVSRHLLGTGRGDEARKVIAELNGVSEDSALVVEIVEALDFAIRAENEGGKATWLECFSTRNALWRRTMNGMMLQFIQQLNGQNFYCNIRQLIDASH